jgi:glutamate/tyrosine decarboxylase-like PLP-dependent enzyme
VLAELKNLSAGDVNWRQGRSWSLVYSAGEEHNQFVVDAYAAYFSENGLSPTAFPSLGQMEAEVVGMMCDLLGGEPKRCGGSMTSGGTESTLLAVKAYRDRFRARHGASRAQLSIVVPTTAHPAFAKAAHFLDLDLRTTPVDGDQLANVEAMSAAIDETTVMIGASAPCYPYGLVDPLAELGELALARGVGFHVDAALGGIMLPILRQLGRDVPYLGLDIPGVTSIAVDLHKYGYGPKGAATVLYTDDDLRRHQYFAYLDWPGGVLASPTMLGTRPGGAISASWAVLRHLGRDGYRDIFATVMKITEQLQNGILAIDGLQVIGDPPMSVFAFGSVRADVWSIADRLETAGWRIDRQRDPDCIHLIVNPTHGPIVDEFLTDLAAARASAPDRTTSPKRAMYGVTTPLDEGADTASDVLDYLDRQLNR